MKKNKKRKRKTTVTKLSDWGGLHWISFCQRRSLDGSSSSPQHRLQELYKLSLMGRCGRATAFCN